MRPIQCALNPSLHFIWDAVSSIEIYRKTELLKTKDLQQTFGLHTVHNLYIKNIIYTCSSLFSSVLFPYVYAIYYPKQWRFWVPNITKTERKCCCKYIQHNLEYSIYFSLCSTMCLSGTQSHTSVDSYHFQCKWTWWNKLVKLVHRQFFNGYFLLLNFLI